MRPLSSAGARGVALASVVVYALAVSTAAEAARCQTGGLLEPILGAAAAHYLSIADEFNPRIDAFKAKLRWTRTPDPARLDAARTAAVAALTRNISELEPTRWPPAAAGYVRALAARTQKLLVVVQAMPAARPRLDGWRERVTAADRTISVAGQEIRRALGAPQLSGA